MMVHFDEPPLIIRWDDDTKTVWAEWREAPSAERYRRGLAAALELIQQKTARRWLGGIQNLASLSVEHLKWTSEDWTPRALAAGLRWMALIRPKKVLMKMIVKSYVTRVDERDLI